MKKFLNPDIDSNILIINGERGSGKSEILEYINKVNSNSVLINISSFTKSANFWRQFFNRLIYSDFLYNQIDESLEHYISLHIEDESSNLVNELKSIFAKISKKSKFILLMDDIENTNPRIIETLSELLPILQANNIKIILSKNVDTKDFFDKLKNTTEILIEPLTSSLLWGTVVLMPTLPDELYITNKLLFALPKNLKKSVLEVKPIPNE